MASVTFATPLRATPRPWRYSEPTNHFYHDDAGFALSEAEANEFAIRLLDARSEPDFDHLLGAILTHAAARSDGWLSPTMGSALGGLPRVACSRLARGEDLGRALTGAVGGSTSWHKAEVLAVLAATARENKLLCNAHLLDVKVCKGRHG
jgi:hypothetical protein